ncbi:MAG TPA: PASTA domain-containing protein [Actinoplanes sp.]|nr:PASTA domain-containing protein [Actinoplanes sp.]
MTYRSEGTIYSSGTGPAHGDRSSPDQRNDNGPHRKHLINNLVLPLVVAVVGALAAVVVTPVGTAARELFFRTRAAISGVVEMNGVPLVQAGVRLNELGGASTTTDNAGHFKLSDVERGDHKLLVEAAGARTGDGYQFAVTAGATAADLGVIKVEPLVVLGHFVSVRPPKKAGQKKVTYDLTLWVAGDPDTLGKVQAASYTLPAPLPPTDVEAGGRGASFCYRLKGSVKFADLAVLGGAFAAAQAAVRLTDGRTFGMSAAPGAQQPVPCGAKKRIDPIDEENVIPVPATARIPSDGPQTQVRVPHVDGKTEAEARTALEKAGFRPTIERTVDPSFAEGLVIGTQPAGGTLATRGAPVTVRVSALDPNGSTVPTEPTVPAVVGLTEEKATALLNGLGINVAVKQELGFGVGDRIVTEQRPEAGERASSVTIVVRAGKPAK